MATSSSALPRVSLSLLFLLFLFLGSGMNSLLVEADAEAPKTWCVAKPSAQDKALYEIVNYACSMVDCSVLKEGGSCFYPDTLMNHASVSMNLYYQANGRNYWNCNFNGSGVVTKTDPSSGSCKYA